jgi:hypothetical protein
MYILPLFQELEFEIDEVRFDELEGAFEIEHQSVVDLHDKRDFQIATHQFFKDDEYMCLKWMSQIFRPAVCINYNRELI